MECMMSVNFKNQKDQRRERALAVQWVEQCPPKIPFCQLGAPGGGRMWVRVLPDVKEGFR